MSAPEQGGLRLRRIAAIGGGLVGVAALAGCAPSAAPGTTATSADTAPSTATSSASAAGSDLKDGSYTATGDYQSPGGASAIGVTLTLKDGTITALKVVPKAENATAQQYEAQFASGVGAVAIGKPIEGLQVGAVSGSSLTGQGFEKALAAIRTEAAA